MSCLSYLLLLFFTVIENKDERRGIVSKALINCGAPVPYLEVTSSIVQP